MELKHQVVSLELAKKLKELRVKQESVHAWKIWRDGTANLLVDVPSVPDDCVSAFTVAELGEMLPGNDGECCFVTQKGLMGNLWYCSRETMYSKRSEHTEEAKTEADARAKMLIYLLESSLIKEPVM